MGKTIIFDVDGVLADFVLSFTKECGAPEPWGTRGHSGKWDFSDYFSKETINQAWEQIKDNPYWWMVLEPMVSRSVFEQINKLQWDNHVLFVTARVSYHNAQWQTQMWLRHQGVSNPNVVVSAKKGEIAAAVGADYHIDDKPENAACVHWMADRQPCRSYFLEIAGNTKGVWLPEKVRRITTVSEFLADIEEGKE